MISKLANACAKSLHIRDEAAEDDWFAVMTEVAMSYPIDVSKAAIEKWRATNKWWPTEKDLRDLCEGLAAPRRSLRQELMLAKERLEDQEERFRTAKPLPGYDSAISTFREEMREALGPHRQTYLCHCSIIFENGVAYVRSPVSVHTLKRFGRDVIMRTGIEPVFDPSIKFHPCTCAMTDADRSSAAEHLREVAAILGKLA